MRRRTDCASYCDHTTFAVLTPHGSVGMTITQEVLDALPETGGVGRHLPALVLFSKADDPVDVAGADGRRYMIGWAGGIRYKKALPTYWPVRLGAEHAVTLQTRPSDR